MNDNNYFYFISARPQGKSYLFFTQFKAELKGAKIQYANAYVSIKKTTVSTVICKCCLSCLHEFVFVAINYCCV